MTRRLRETTSVALAGKTTLFAYRDQLVYFMCASCVTVQCVYLCMCASVRVYVNICIHTFECGVCTHVYVHVSAVLGCIMHVGVCTHVGVCAHVAVWVIITEQQK